MSLWFRIDDDAWLFASSDRPCGLSGVTCETCGTWAIFRCVYPTIACNRLPRALAVPGPTPLAVFRAQCAAVRARIGDDRPLFPGVSFGPPCAPITRAPPPVFKDAATSGLLLREEVAQDPAIRALGLRLARFVAKTARSGKSYVLYEVEAWPVATRPPRVLAARMRRVKPPCPACGFHRTPPYDIDRPDPLLRSSLDGLHVVRLDHAPGMMFVSAAFRDALVRHRPSRTLSFVPVKVVDA